MKSCKRSIIRRAQLRICHAICYNVKVFFGKDIEMMFTEGLKTLISEGLDLVYPDALYCICCGKIIDESRPYRLCNECMDGVKWATGRTCLRCGKPLSEIDHSDTCYSCRENDHVFDRGVTCAEYGTHERAIVFALKYNGRTDIAGTIAEIMDDRLSNASISEDIDVVMHVPMFRRKKLERGFDQAELIAVELARRRGIPFRGDLIVRSRETKAMRGLAPAERRANLDGAFGYSDRYGPEDISDAVRGMNILVVDDIYTTGATADAIAGMLRRNGAKKVHFISFAAGADVVKSL